MCSYLRVTTLAAGQRVRALVVDDVLENRDVLSKMLASLGWAVFAALRDSPTPH